MNIIFGIRLLSTAIRKNIYHMLEFVQYNSSGGLLSWLTHCQVNHKYNSVNPISGPQTQNLEKVWVLQNGEKNDIMMPTT